LISKETIALVRDRTDVVAVISEHVPSLKRRGRSWVGLCPFHKEKTPSFHVNPDRGFFHCFGCKEAGSAVDFIMKVEGATFPEAVRSLAERAGIAVEEERGEPTEIDRQKKQRDDLYAVNQLAATYFEQQLQEHPQRQYALDELARRGLVPSGVHGAEARGQEGRAPSTAIDDALQAFRIGYAPSAWDGLASFFRAQGVSPILGEAVGLLVPRSSGTGHYDRFRHRLMFAVIDPQGRVVAFSGRALAPLPGETGDPGHKPAKYINSPESPIYTKGAALFGLYQARHAIRQQESAVIVEGNFDVVSLHAAGVDNVVAPLGTAFTVDQARLLKRFAPTAILLFDADLAGRKAAKMSREPCRAAKLEAKVAALPQGMDPDQFVRERGAAALTTCLASAEGMLESLIAGSLDESFVAADVQERAQRIKYVKQLLSEEDDALVRGMCKTYADQLSARLDLHGLGYKRDETKTSEPFRALERSVIEALAVSGPPNGPTAKQARVVPRAPGSLERREIVGDIIEQPALLDDPEVQAELAMLEGVSAQVIAAVSDSIRIVILPPQTGFGASSAVHGDPPKAPAQRDQAGVRPQKTLDTSNFLAQIPPAIQAFASERLAAPQHESLEEAKTHLLDNARKLRRVLLERETVELAREQYKAGDWQVEVELAREADARVRQKLGAKSSS
jgi:DNA primase